MKNISFDNPRILLLAIPLALAVVIPYFIIRNKDNRSVLWGVSVGIHLTVILLAVLAAAGMNTTRVLTKTTVYVVADVSYSSDKNLDVIDDYIEEARGKLPENSKLGVVCFGKNSVLLSRAGREIKSVRESNPGTGGLDNSGTDIVQALTYTEGLFEKDTLKRIILITDGNDTENKEPGAVAATVQRLTEKGIKVDTVFLDNSAGESETELQLSEAEHSSTAFLGTESLAKFHIRSASATNARVDLYYRQRGSLEWESLDYTVIGTQPGINTVSMSLVTDQSGIYEYRAVVSGEGDGSEFNNAREFEQEVVGKARILLVTGNEEDDNVVRLMYGDRADIDTCLVRTSHSDVPFTLEDMVEYDEIVLSNVDVRNIRNANAFIDTLDLVVSQYGKSLTTIGDLGIHNEPEDYILAKLSELLPVDYGRTARDGKLYTIVLDVSESMFMASKFTIAKDAAIKLLTLLDDDDYVCLVTFSGKIEMRTPELVKDCRVELAQYIDSLTTDHGTDIGLGLEEALKAVNALNLADNQVMLISDGFSFDSTIDAVSASRNLYARGAAVSAITAYIPSDGNSGVATMQRIVDAGEGGNHYRISRPEDVSDVVLGDVSEEVNESVIRKNSTVNINRFKDGIVRGFTSSPRVGGYIQSLARYDATVPLTVNYERSNGYTTAVPLYAYRSHGNGRVSSFTSGISGFWVGEFSAEDREQFIGNLFDVSIPKERQDYPFSVKVEKDYVGASIELTPGVLDPDAEATVKITYPGGRTITRTLTFDSRKFYYSFDTGAVGVYRMELSYRYGDKEYDSRYFFEIPYLAEYDAFANFDKSVVNEFMRGNGRITEGEIPSLENDKDEISTYRMSYSIPLLIVAVVLFVADVLIRKIKVKRRMPRPRADKEGAKK